MRRHPNIETIFVGTPNGQFSQIHGHTNNTRQEEHVVDKSYTMKIDMASESLEMQ